MSVTVEQPGHLNWNSSRDISRFFSSGSSVTLSDDHVLNSASRAQFGHLIVSILMLLIQSAPGAPCAANAAAAMRSTAPPGVNSPVSRRSQASLTAPAAAGTRA